MRLRHLTMLLVAICTGCDGVGPNSSEQTLLVQHHMSECVGETIRLCLLVRQPNDPAFGHRYAPIDDFDYEWGVTYEIEVAERSVADPAAGGVSSTRTVLDSVVSRQRVTAGTQFKLYLTAGEDRIVRVADNRYLFYGEREFTCSVSECDAIAPRIAAGERMLFTFTHPAQSTDPLVLVESEICDRALVGSTLCMP